MSSRRLVPLSFSTLAFLVLLATACRPPVEAPRQIKQYAIEDFLGTIAVTGSSFSPDKSKVLVSSDETGIFNAFALPVDGGEPIQLTHSKTDAVQVSGYFPNDERFLYSSDQGGNELNHLYVRELDGTILDLTPGEKLKALFGGWAPDDKSFFVLTNERDGRFFDLFEIQLDGYGRELLYQDEVGYQFADISADRRYLAFEKPRTTADSDIYVFDRQTKEMKHITPHEGDVSNSPQAFSPDGSRLLFTTDEGSEFRYLVAYDMASGTREVVDQPDWDVMYAYFSKHGKYLVVGVNEDASTEIRVYETAGMKRIKLPDLGDSDINAVNFSADETRMTFYMSNSRNPRDLFVYDLGATSKPQQLTHSLNPSIDSADLVDAQVVRFASYDGVEIPGILYVPHGASAESKVPALVWVHGGPGGQSRAGYSGLMQYLVNHGYALYAINNRGSSGYGKTFFKMDDRKHGEADLGDCIASKQMLIDTGYVDPEKIGIIGGSYGGYMVLAALAFQPEEFEVGVDIFGVANWVRTLESIPPWWESFRQALYQELGDPAVDGERLHRISPLFHAENIVKPLLVLQGANDPRVLQVESDEMVQAARNNGAAVDYIVFDDEGHGFSKKENQLEGYAKILDFLNVHLKGEPPEPQLESAAAGS